MESVVVNTSGCGAHMKAYGPLLAGDPAWRERAERFSSKVRDLAEFLATEPLRGLLGAVNRTVTYHDPCHVVHGQKISKQPRALLSQIPGLNLVPLKEADWCCGSAGTYNLTQPEMSERLGRRKMDHIAATFDARLPKVDGAWVQGGTEAPFDADPQRWRRRPLRQGTRAYR